MNGKLYGIGIGPGDPELITLKAARILKTVDVVAIPSSRNEKDSIALRIAGEHIKNGTEILKLTFPMTGNENDRLIKRRENAMIVKEMTDNGKTVAYLTLGDPMLYSTFIYILDHLKNQGVEIETIPGITSFCAISSSCNIPMAKQNENLSIIPLSRDTDIEGIVNNSDNIVFMKVSTDNRRLADILKKYRESSDILIATKCGTMDETFSSEPDDLSGEVPYLTTVLYKKERDGKK